MPPLHDLWLPKHNPLIARLHEFNNSASGVAAFLDECEERGIVIEGVEVVPEHWRTRNVVEFLLTTVAGCRRESVECEFLAESPQDEIWIRFRHYHKQIQGMNTSTSMIKRYQVIDGQLDAMKEEMRREVNRFVAKLEWENTLLRIVFA